MRKQLLEPTAAPAARQQPRANGPQAHVQACASTPQRVQLMCVCVPRESSSRSTKNCPAKAAPGAPSALSNNQIVAPATRSVTSTKGCPTYTKAAAGAPNTALATRKQPRASGVQALASIPQGVQLMRVPHFKAAPGAPNIAFVTRKQRREHQMRLPYKRGPAFQTVKLLRLRHAAP